MEINGNTKEEFDEGEFDIPAVKLNIHHHVIMEFDGDLERFVSTRKNQDMNQYQLSQALGYSERSTIGHFEAGSKGLDSRGYTLFCLLTNTHPSYILEQGEDDGELLIKAPADGYSIRQTRLNANGMTQPKMAKLLGLSSKTLVSNYENNRKNPSIQNWTLFLLITDQHPHYLIKPCLA